jgi:ATP/maltotriose-dependent transcriptional regulator MalT
VAAVEHALAGDDLEYVGRLIAPLVLALESTGRGATTRRWLDALGPETIERLPALALAAGWFAALGGDASNAQRWLAIAERRADEGFPALGAASTASAVALLRAVMSPAGVKQMRADAEFAVESEPPWGPWHRTAAVARGFSHVLAGDDAARRGGVGRPCPRRPARRGRHNVVGGIGTAGARTILRDSNDLRRERPDLGIVAEEAESLAEQVPTLPATIAGATTLTPAELRLLPLLPTHLSFPEIGTRLFLSRHTVKTQAIAVYHKLGVSSRGEAVARARDIGLLDESVSNAATGS